jgi:hypothetical protein
MDRNSMIDRLIDDDKAKIKRGFEEGDTELLESILLYGIGYDKQTLREVIDAYNTRIWEE